MTDEEDLGVARRVLHWYRLEPPSLPIRHWVPQYERRWLRPDLIAAAAVWAVLVPEGIAYASPAGYLNTELFAFFAPILLILFRWEPGHGRSPGRRSSEKSRRR